jgi:hypothetical protein
MEIGTSLRWLQGMLGIGGCIGGLYGLHRLALWMEDRGIIYYIRKEPSGSPLGSFIALQKVIEPRAEYVLRAPCAYQRTDQESGQATDPDSIETNKMEGHDSGPR